MFIIPTDELGGAEQLLKTLVRNLIESENKVEVLCLTVRGKGHGWDDLKEMVTYQPTGSVYKGLLAMASYFREKSFDMVMSSQVYINGALGILRRFGILKTQSLVVRESTSIFVRFRGLKREGYRQFYRLGYSYADLVIYQTGFMQDQLLKNIPQAAQWKNVVLHNPIDLQYILSEAGKEYENTGPQYILGVGRLIPQKGFDILINAFARIAPKFPDLKLRIIGEGSSRESLEALVQSLDMQEKVDMPGFVSNPFPLMKNATLCAVASRIEGFPNTLLQMMALNPRVFTTLCAGGVDEVPFVAKIPTDDEDALVAAMEKMLSSEGFPKAQRIDYLEKRSVSAYLRQIEHLLGKVGCNLE